MKYAFPLLAILATLSCGPSVKEQARAQQLRDDSIRIATENVLKAKQQQKDALKEQIQNGLAIKEGHQNRLALFKAELAAEQDKLNVIKQPQFLRTPEERTQQIKHQMLVIDRKERSVLELQESLSAVDDMLKGLQEKLRDIEYE
jgi:hypothetical protein